MHIFLLLICLPQFTWQTQPYTLRGLRKTFLLYIAKKSERTLDKEETALKGYLVIKHGKRRLRENTGEQSEITAPS